ncbi:MAG: trigger factor, partial [Holosporales bacterium]|nr:trigger factor [Holosporales bacterium]
MKIEKIKSEGLSYEYSVIFSAAEIASEIDSRIKTRSRSFRMPGFRPGHVPYSIVRKKVGPDVIHQVMEKFVDRASENVIREANIKILAYRPTYKVEQDYADGKDVKLVFYIEAAPEFEIKPYQFEISKIVPVVSDEDVEEDLQSRLKNFPFYELAEEGYEIKPQDVILYKATCYVNGRENKRHSFSQEAHLPAVIPEDNEFLQSFLGKKVSEEFDYTPPQQDSSTQTDIWTYKIHIEAIQKALIDLSIEEYAVKAGCEDKSDLRTKIKQDLETRIENEAYLYHKNQFIEAILEQYSFDVPQRMVDIEIRNIVMSVKKSQKPEELKSDEELYVEYTEIGKQRVLLGCVLDRIARIENITASDDEVRSVLYWKAMNSANPSEETYHRYCQDAGMVAYTRAEITERKVFDLL